MELQQRLLLKRSDHHHRRHPSPSPKLKNCLNSCSWTDSVHWLLVQLDVLNCCSANCGSVDNAAADDYDCARDCCWLLQLRRMQEHLE